MSSVAICSGVGRPRTMRSGISGLDGPPPLEAGIERVPPADRVLPVLPAEEHEVVVLPRVEVEEARRRVLDRRAQSVDRLHLRPVALRQILGPRDLALALRLVVAGLLREGLQAD